MDFKDESESESYEIRLQVEDLKTGNIKAQAELGLKKDGEGFLAVKEDTKPGLPISGAGRMD